MLQNTTASLQKQHASVSEDFQTAQRESTGRHQQKAGQLLSARNRLRARIDRYEGQERIAQEELEEMRYAMFLRIEGRRSADNNGAFDDGDPIHVIPFEALEVWLGGKSVQGLLHFLYFRRLLLASLS